MFATLLLLRTWGRLEWLGEGTEEVGQGEIIKFFEIILIQILFWFKTLYYFFNF